MVTSFSSLLSSEEIECWSQLSGSELDDQLDRLPTETADQVATAVQTAMGNRRQATIDANLAKYCPHTPFPKQREFMNLTCPEAFFGGSAGPGKSDGLLMLALQYVDVPQYAALVLRRDFPRLSLPGSIMARAKSWLAGTDARWIGIDKIFRFPSGAGIQFGYIDNPDDRFRYQSSEYQLVIWDELTEFRLQDDENNPYLFLYSRLRRTEDNPVPLRMRSASNPGNIGHEWVKRRFVTQEAIKALADDSPRTFYVDDAKTRAFVPALLKDNPAIRAEEYIQGLMHLPALTRARLLKGDWSVKQDALIGPDKLSYYTVRGNTIFPLKGSKVLFSTGGERMMRFATVDTAGTSKQKAAEDKGKKHSWSCCAVWDHLASSDLLFLRYLWRGRLDWSDLQRKIPEILGQWGVSTVIIENAHHGGPLGMELGNQFTVEMVNPMIPGMKTAKSGPAESAKLERAIASGLFERLEKGTFFLPDIGTVADCVKWMPDLESELLGWTGRTDETDDQVDLCSYASNHVKSTGQHWGGVIRNAVLRNF